MSVGHSNDSVGNQICVPSTSERVVSNDGSMMDAVTKAYTRRRYNALFKIICQIVLIAEQHGARGARSLKENTLVVELRDAQLCGYLQLG